MKLVLSMTRTLLQKASCEGMFEVTAKGHTKKHAEQKAAYEALVQLKKRGLHRGRIGYIDITDSKGIIYVFKEYRGSGL